ncbi:J domain-containing protein [Kiloniella majae]|uniref:J domain-containing protein n=1 Tax=Kiloniella majae TaxID=1938558 RepID=UPI000A277032|nr:J domain-containing protein [Kiloniella majae]
MKKSVHDASLQTPWDPAEMKNCCDAEGCENAGEYRAPKSRVKLNSYYWFCLDHVREYNTAWNYCKDMDVTDVDRLRRQDAVWGKPTWPLNGAGKENYAKKLDDLGKAWRSFAGYDDKQSEQTRKFMPEEERQALRILGLDTIESLKQIKKRYLALAKELHPDTNGGAKGAEDRLKKVNQAYSLLKNSIFIKETLQETDLTS